jgi:bud emergence protein 1
MKLTEDEGKSEASDYEDEGYAASPPRRHPNDQYYDRRGDSQQSTSLRQHAIAQNHERSGSTTSFGRPRSSNSRSGSPAMRNYSPPRGPRSPPTTTTNTTTPTNTTFSSSSSSSTRSHSISNNVNSPPISAANSQAAFIKIKIFDRVADDLIAIRVHPKVSHAELMDKVRARLGSEVAQLRYRDSMNRQFVEIHGDRDLNQWLQGTDKHVLYAD